MGECYVNASNKSPATTATTPCDAKNLEMSVGNAGVVKALVFRVFEQSFGQQDRVRQTEGRR